MLRIVADTNIYISAFNFGGVPDQVLTLARRGRIEMFVSEPILYEIDRVLKRKFRWPPRRTRDALSSIREFAKETKPSRRIDAVLKDETDNRILECALAANAAAIVTGDSHLLELNSFGQIRILSPRAFLDAIER